jgi:hypothetical protein
MPRFYLHLWTGAEYITDQEGDELESADAAYLEAFEAAKEMAADLIRAHADATHHRFDVFDRSGRVLFEVPFTEVLGTAPKLVRRAEPNTEVDKRHKALMEAVAHEIGVARVTIAAARETMARSHRSSPGLDAAPGAAHSAKQS